MATKIHTNQRSISIVFLIFALILTACNPKESASQPLSELKEWDLLIISDSTNWGVGQYYAKLIEADLNVKVNLHDCWIGTLPILDTLQTLQSGGIWSSGVGDSSCQKPLTDLVKEAEVMVLFGNPIVHGSPSRGDQCVLGGYEGRNKLSGFEEYRESLLASCSPENFNIYKTNIGMVIDEIYKIRGGRPLILRMTDVYIPEHSRWTLWGVDEECTACLGASAEAIRQVAEEHGVPVADTMTGFNGNDYMLDPVEAGYIREDGVHPSETGAQFIATILQQTGYTISGK
jgi:hypothetical protein